ncbi:MAG: cyclic-di-AMP receptor [Bacillota bacterium]
MGDNSTKMKMVIAIVHDSDASSLRDNLTKARFQITKLSSSGGFLREGNTIFVIGTEEKYLDELIEILKENCEHRDETVASMSPVANSLESYYSFPMEVEVGGATVFVIDVEQFYKL